MPEKKQAIVVGGGIGGLETALYLCDRLRDAADVTLISDRTEFVFKPYLTYVPFGLDPNRVRLALGDLAGAHGFQFRPGTAREVLPERHVLRVDGDVLTYDALFLATGVSPAPTLDGLPEHAFVLGREGDMHRLRAGVRRLREEPPGGDQRQHVVFLVPPACGWAGALYELAFMLTTWLDWKGARDTVAVTLLTAESRFMDVFGLDVHRTIQQDLRARGIDAHRRQRLARVEKDALVYPDGRRLPYDLLVAAPSHEATTRWAALPADERGFLLTESSSRQVADHPAIYAVGDASDHPVKQAFLALLQADAAAEHWAASLTAGEAPAFGFEPQGAWLMEQFDQALMARGPLGEDDPGPAQADRLPVGQLRRLLASEHLPRRGGAFNPLYSGLLWKGTETGLKVLKHLSRHEAP